ncbi:MAG: response regulator transcription factor [Clostridia bacterium]|nr:response regulator transcription factor [Clostridia bacterium]
MFRVLVAEDDPGQRKMMCAFLRMNGYEVFDAGDGIEALELLKDIKIDIAICDIMMPRLDGYELTRALREYDKRLPILIVTAKSDFSDKQLGFLAGADDYMVKPVDLDEMLLRIKALFRRANMQSDHLIRVGDTTLNDLDLSITVKGEKRTLPKKEFGLLFMLLSYPNMLLTRRQLMDEVWGVSCDTDERTVDVHIKRLREKLSDVDDFKISTVRGLGYRSEVSQIAKA